MSSSPSYYDIDAILAEEELVPCTTLFQFSNLSHLDPSNHNIGEDDLEDGSSLKMPLWAVEKWAMLGFVRLSLPRHYSKRSRERLEADPGDADLRKRSERFFASGQYVINMIEKSSTRVAKAIASSPGWRNARRTVHTEALEKVVQDAMELRQTLLKAFSGERLRRTLDWALSSGDDDVSKYTSRLTDMEQTLFISGASSVAAQLDWKLHGNMRLLTYPADLNPQNHRSVTNEEGNGNMSDPVGADIPGDNGAKQIKNKRQRLH